MLPENWNQVTQLLLVGVLAYAGLVLMLRVSGNRTLSKMNSFDLVVTVALGSVLASVLTSKNVSLVEGLIAIALLVILQFGVTWLTVRLKAVNRIIKTQPTLLFRDGSFLPDAMKQVRITEDEIRAAARQQGIGEIEQMSAVVMESDGSLSVIARKEKSSLSALKGVHGFDDRQDC